MTSQIAQLAYGLRIAALTLPASAANSPNPLNTPNRGRLNTLNATVAAPPTTASDPRFRAVTHYDSREIARTTVAMLGHPANRVFYMLDHVMVPINLRWTAEQIHGELAKSGAKNIRRLERGASFDRTEAIYQDRPFAAEMFGVGEHRFVFSR